MRKFMTFSMLGGLSIFLFGTLALSLPPVKSRLEWRLDEWRAQIKYWVAPPEQVVFIPKQGATFTPRPGTDPPQFPVDPVTPTPMGTLVISTATPVPTTTPTATPTILPDRVQLTGAKHEYQTWNNCGPATLAMALSFWGWEGNQADIAPFTKPNPRDKNVMPYEMVNYVETQTSFGIFQRTGGDIPLLKSFLAAGFPVVIEKGFEGADFDGWMGHYELLTGYEDTTARFTAQDSYLGPDIQVPYEQVENQWRAFNYTYLAVFPLEKRDEVIMLLGSNADPSYNYQYTANKALEDINALTGRDQYFAWYNRGTSLAALFDYTGAAAAFDQAFALYPTILEKQRPWRMLWYQTGPYWAYFYTGRYSDVIDLATKTLENTSEPVLEESFYWRALAREAVGDISGAREDFLSAIEVHPGFGPALDHLQRLGTDP